MATPPGIRWYCIYATCAPLTGQVYTGQTVSFSISLQPRQQLHSCHHAHDSKAILAAREELEERPEMAWHINVPTPYSGGHAVYVQVSKTLQRSPHRSQTVLKQPSNLFPASTVPFHLCDRLLPQALVTLCLLQGSINPHIFASLPLRPSASPAKLRSRLVSHPNSPTRHSHPRPRKTDCLRHLGNRSRRRLVPRPYR
jgi:hypothetical protein